MELRRYPHRCRLLSRRTTGIVFLAFLIVAGGAPGNALARWPTPAGGASASGNPEILFTFDDGPHEKYTPRILDMLAKNNIQAVFFWVGHRIRRKGRRSQKRKRILARAIREGHLIANHTINHVHLCNVSRNLAEREIDENARMYEKATGLPMILFRAPYGDYCKRLIRMLSERKLEHMHWDIDAREWKHRSGRHAANRVIQRIKKLQGRAIILFHDTKLATPIALPIVLRWISRENRRRRQANKPLIRILNASEFVAEKYQSPLVQWLRFTTLAMTDQAMETFSRAIP